MGQPDASKHGVWIGARHLLWGGRMLANMGSGSGARHLLRAGRMLANMGSGSGTRHLLRAGRMLANRGLDLVPGTRSGAGGC